MSYLPCIIDDKHMALLESSGDAEILHCDAAEEEFGLGFRKVRSHQLVAKVTETKYYKRTQLGFREIPARDMEAKP